MHLHTRLTPELLPLLLPHLLAILSTTVPNSTAVGKDAEKDREKEDKDRLARQRPVLRIVAELAMAGAWAEGAEKGAGEVGKVMKGLVSIDSRFRKRC